MAEPDVVVAGCDLLVADLLSSVLVDGDLPVVAVVISGADLIAAVQRHGPRLVVATTTVGPDSLVDLLPQMLAGRGRVLAVDTEASADPADLLLAGASGFLALHDLGTHELVRAARSVAAGDAALHPAAAEIVLRLWRDGGRSTPSRSADAALTGREAELLRSMVDGLSNKAAAQRLGVTVKTIEAHKSKVFAKLGVRTQAQAVAAALAGASASDDQLPEGGEP